MKRKLSSILPIIIIIIALVYLFDFDDTSTPTTTSVADTDSLVVRYLDVGQADATIFHLNDADEEYVVLYDVGDWQGEEVVDYLHDQQIEAIDLIIVSHPHADHIGQLNPILEQFSVEEVWMTGNETDTNLFISTMETLLADDSINYNEPELGDEYKIGPLHIEVLHPEPTELTGDLNEDSLSILATFGEVKFLFTGDAGVKTELEIIDNHQHIEAHFLQLGHHGSNTSSDASFIEAVNPAYAIYSAGKNNSYGHPSPEVVDLLKGKNIPLLGTDTDGTITVTTDGNDFEISAEKGNISAVDERTQSNNSPAKSCVDLNKATQAELETIIHINKERAAELIELRPFTALEQLTEVKGIGPKRLEDIEDENKACIE